MEDDDVVRTLAVVNTGSLTDADADISCVVIEMLRSFGHLTI